MKESLSSSSRTAYPSDVTDRQWELIDELLPADAERGRTREHSLREVVNAVNYRWLTGCSWRMLPHDLPQWQTVYKYFRRWQREGLLSPLREILISRSLRLSRAAESSAVSTQNVPGQEAVVRPTTSSVPSTPSLERATSSWSTPPAFAQNRS